MAKQIKKGDKVRYIGGKSWEKGCADLHLDYDEIYEVSAVRTSSLRTTFVILQEIPFNEFNVKLFEKV